MKYRIISQLILATLVAVVLFSAGCNKPAPAADDDVAQVDPRFASAESLLDYYNSLTTTEPVNVASLVPLFRAENDSQRRYIGILRNMVALGELDYKMYKQFGEPLDPKKKKPMLTPSKPATFIKRESDRAQAEQVDSDGKTSTIYMIHADDRWWVSGFTIEYDKEFTGSIDDIGRYEQFMRASASAANRVMRDLLTGKIQSAAQARTAFGAEMLRNSGNN